MEALFFSSSLTVRKHSWDVLLNPRICSLGVIENGDVVNQTHLARYHWDTPATVKIMMMQSYGDTFYSRKETLKELFVTNADV